MVITKMSVNGHRTEGHTLKGVSTLYNGMKCKLVVHTASDRIVRVDISKKDAINLLESGDVRLSVHTLDKLWIISVA